MKDAVTPSLEPYRFGRAAKKKLLSRTDARNNQAISRRSLHQLHCRWLKGPPIPTHRQFLWNMYESFHSQGCWRVPSSNKVNTSTFLLKTLSYMKRRLERLFRRICTILNARMNWKHTNTRRYVHGMGQSSAEVWLNTRPAGGFVSTLLQTVTTRLLVGTDAGLHNSSHDATQ